MTLPPVIDTHCHLDHRKYAPGEVEELVARAQAQGVTRLITIGCAADVSSVSAAIDIASQRPEVCRATVGVHPHDAASFDEELAEAVEAAAVDPLVVAVGEMGLDFYYDSSPREAQRTAFRRQIAIARRVKKPIVVHTRSAPEETLAILEEESASDVGGVIHCFSEDSAFARAALELGFVSSFSGLVTFKRNVDGIRDAALHQPLDALLVETDAPFLAPVPYRGKRNEPSYVVAVARAIANLRGLDEAELRARTTENAERLFGRW